VSINLSGHLLGGGGGGGGGPRGRQPGPPRLLFLAGGAALLLVAGAALDPFAVVSSGHVGIKTEFGAIMPTLLQPGLHFVAPFISAVHEVSVQPHTSSTEETSATHDQQNVTTTTAVTWAVDANYADQVYRDFRGAEGLEATIIAPIVSNDVKAVVADYEAQALITQRSKVAAEIAQLISTDLARYHARVSVGGVNLTNMQFSQQYDQAIEEKQIAQQNALKARYTLEQIQTSAQQQVVQAHAAADAAVATATGQARATVLQAQADAEAYRAKEAALSPALLQLTALQRWNGVLPAYMGGQTPIPFLTPPQAK
jgi:regulator of protease activity HflC (stomatin/prohibitin superfamily)